MYRNSPFAAALLLTCLLATAASAADNHAPSDPDALGEQVRKAMVLAISERDTCSQAHTRIVASAAKRKQALSSALAARSAFAKHARAAGAAAKHFDIAAHK